MAMQTAASSFTTTRYLALCLDYDGKLDRLSA